VGRVSKSVAIAATLWLAHVKVGCYPLTPPPSQFVVVALSVSRVVLRWCSSASLASTIVMVGAGWLGDEFGVWLWHSSLLWNCWYGLKCQGGLGWWHSHDGNDRGHHLAIPRDWEVRASPITRGRVVLVG
jgi:hypothetical protein